ncbi:MAG: acetylglutamate/acetylaminoadipate kinase [Halobacteriota archaeon]
MSAHVFYTEDEVIEFGEPTETVGRLGEDGPVVVKVGGAAAVDVEAVAADVAHHVANGRSVVVVHGGSTTVDALLERLGLEPTYVETPSGVVGRFTDASTMEVFTMAVAGQVNTTVTTALRNEGVDAVGLSGVDGGIVTGPRKGAVRVLEGDKTKIKRGDHAGRIESVDDHLLRLLLEAGYVPVIGPPMLGGEPDGAHTPVNVDADRFAAAIAGTLGGDLILLTDVAGVYRDPDDPSTRIETVDTSEALAALERVAEGFMTRKVMAAREALEGGAGAVVIADGTRRKPLVNALAGGGTTVHPRALAPSEP